LAVINFFMVVPIYFIANSVGRCLNKFTCNKLMDIKFAIRSLKNSEILADSVPDRVMDCNHDLFVAIPVFNWAVHVGSICSVTPPVLTVRPVDSVESAGDIEYVLGVLLADFGHSIKHDISIVISN